MYMTPPAVTTEASVLMPMAVSTQPGDCSRIAPLRDKRANLFSALRIVNTFGEELLQHAGPCWRAADTIASDRWFVNCPARNRLRAAEAHAPAATDGTIDG